MAEATDNPTDADDEKDLIAANPTGGAKPATEQTDVPTEKEGEEAATGEETAAGEAGAAADSGGDDADAAAGDDSADETLLAADSAPIKLEPDDWDKEWTEAVKELDADDLLTPSEKRTKKLDLIEKRDQRHERRTAEAQKAEDRARNAGAAEHGVSRKVFDAAWTAAVNESTKRLGGRFSHDAAIILFEQKLATARKGGPPGKVRGPEVKPPTSAPLPKNVRVAPAPGKSNLPPAKEKSDEDELLETVRKIPGGIRG